MGKNNFFKKLAAYSKIAAGIYLDRPLVGPSSIQIGLSDACNYRCIMCNVFSPLVINPSYVPAKNLIMDFDLALKLVKDLSEIGTKKVNICGFGESLLFPRIADIVEFIKSSKMEVYITTNGYMLDPQIIDTLLKCKLDGLYVSLNCALSQTYSKIHVGRTDKDFERIISNLTYLKKKAATQNKQVFLSLSFVLMKINYKEIEDFCKLARDIKADNVLFRELGTDCLKDNSLMLDQYAMDYIWSSAKRIRNGPVKNNLYELLIGMPDSDKNKKKTACFAGYIGGALITANGSVYACCNCSTPVGNISEQSFGEIWRSKVYQLFRKRGMNMWRKNARYPAGCLCNTCPTYSMNLKIQRFLYPWR